MRHAVRITLIVVGSVSLLAGIVGIFLPVWPTVPFLLLSAACFLRSSERLYSWLLNHRYLGRHLHGFLSGLGVPARTKIAAITTM